MTAVLNSPFDPVVWQVSAGPPARSYADVCLRHGVALIGPGDAGPWRPDRCDDDFDGRYVSRFAAEVQPGHVFLLRSGLCTICAVGLVAGDYQYLDQFDDVNGWDLQHARRVRWYPLPDPYTFASSVFGANPPRLSRVTHSDLLDYARRFINSPPTDWQTAPLAPLPADVPALDRVPSHLADLVAQVNDLNALYTDTAAFGDLPAEDELVAHYVVPLLRAHGWPPELIAVEWRCIDVCLFSALPRSPTTCRLVIEAKRLGAGVEGALDQARAYVEALGAAPAPDIIVTDGIRYRMYATGRDCAPVAYANLARLKQPALDLFARIRRS